MTRAAAALLDQALTAGVTVHLAEPGRLKLRGDPEALAVWAPRLRPHKAELLALLTDARPTWDITLPDGSGYVSSFAPPATLAQILAAYGPGTQAVPVEDPDPADAPLPPDIEAAVLAWLDRINETCPQTRREALELARRRPDIAQGYRDRASRPAPQKPTGGDQGGAA